MLEYKGNEASKRYIDLSRVSSWKKNDKDLPYSFKLFYIMNFYTLGIVEDIYSLFF